MKKGIIAFAAFALVASAGAAQAQTGAMQIGVVGGMSMAKLTGDDFDGVDARTAPYFGGALVFQPAGSMFGFETGLLYVGKGASEEGEGSELTLKLDYVEVPLLVRIGVPMGSSAIRPVVLLGGSAGFKAGCNLELSGEGGSIEGECEEGEIDVKSFDLGLTGGLNVEFDLTPRWVLAPTVRYTYGLMEVAEDSDAKNTAFQFGAAVRFRM